MKKITLVALLFASLGFYSCQEKNGTDLQKPNFLVLISDNHYADHLGCYGDQTVKTPAIDKIAKNGVRFTNAFCGSPSCTPSRGAMLTGQEIWRLGEGANLWSSLPDSIPTYQELLEEVGYQTGHDRKGWGPGDYQAGGRNKNPAGTTFSNLKEFLDENKGQQPWSYFLSSRSPHRPFEYGSGKKIGLDLDKVFVPAYLPDSPEVRADIADYYASVMSFDKEVQEAMRLLEENGMAKNTIIVVCSDNGWMMPRGLGNLYDFGTKVPLIISWPNHIKENRVITDFVSLNDLAATFLEFAGEKVPERMTARSLKSILISDKEGRINQDFNRVFVARERHAMARKGGLGYPSRALRTDDYLYIRNYEPSRWPAGDPPLFADIDGHMLQYYSPTKEYMMEHKEDPAVKQLYKDSFLKRPKEELFDLRKDPFQLNNVAHLDEYKDVLVQLSKELNNYLVETEDPRETGGTIIWDTSPYYHEEDWIGKPRQEAQDKFNLEEAYPYK
jgi:arylsulfatase A-like enzyme